MKVRTKLSLSYLLLIFFSVIICITGIKGIDIIRDKNRSKTMISCAMNNIQNMQANSLRYIIYGKTEYIDQFRKEEQRALSSIKDTIDLISSKEIIMSTKKMIKATIDYAELNYLFYEKDQKLRSLSAKRGHSAVTIQGIINKLIDLEEAENSDQIKEITLLLKDAQISIFNFHKSGYFYKIATERDLRNLHKNNWYEGINEAENQFLELRTKYKVNSVEQALIKQAVAEFDNYKENVTAFISEEQIQKDLFPEMKTVAGTVGSRGNTVLIKMNNEIKRINQTIILVMLKILVLIVTLSLLVAFLITKTLSRELGGEPDEIMDIVRKISLGNLDISFKDGNNTGVYESVHKMSEKLNETVNSIIHSSQMVSTDSRQISEYSQVISLGTIEQAATIEELAASIEQLAANTARNKENADKSREMTRKIASDSHESRAAVSETLDAMKELSQKITLVKEIARQTNMLSLNIAIEAKNAGESGNGFSIIAREVKRLSELSRSAAEEIAKISKHSVAKAVQAHQMIEQIIPDMKSTVCLVEKISIASEEQNRGAAHINKAISLLDRAVQQSASYSEELATMSEELYARAESSKKTISYFKAEDTNRLVQTDSMEMIS